MKNEHSCKSFLLIMFSLELCQVGCRIDCNRGLLCNYFNSTGSDKWKLKPEVWSWALALNTNTRVLCPLSWWWPWPLTSSVWWTRSLWQRSWRVSIGLQSIMDKRKYPFGFILIIMTCIENFLKYFHTFIMLNISSFQTWPCFLFTSRIKVII